VCFSPEISIPNTRADFFVVPGSWFQADPAAILPNLFIRFTYAALDIENIPIAVGRFNEALRESFRIEKKEEAVRTML
jgi:DNA-binding transcriptional MocR family regulator